MKQLILVILSLIAITSSAQDTLKKQDTLILSGVEVIGVRGDNKTPISQKTLTKEDISKTYQGQEISYILDKTPSITSQSDGGQPNGYTTFRLRGIDQTRINMTINGVPLNEPEDQGVYFSNYPDFATNIKSMQIQRGVGTSANGTASYGGSINFEGKNGVDKETMAQIGYGSFNTQRVNVGFGSGINENKLAFYTSLSAYQSDGYKYHSGGNGYSFFLSGGYYGGKNVIKFTGFTGHAINQMAWLAVSEDSIKKDPRTNNNPAGENDNFTQSFAQLQYVHSINRYSTITTTAYCNRLDGVWGMFVAQDTLMKFHLGSSFYGIMSNYHFEKNNLTLNIGVHANSYDRMHSGTIDTIKLYTNTGYKVDYSSYAKLGYKLGRFNLFGDAQIRDVIFKYVGDVTMKPLTWTFFNPKGGLTYSYSKNVNYYFSVGQSHREPTRTDLFGGNDNLTTLLTIKPEEVMDYELGSNVKVNKLTVQYNVYFMNFKNEITLLGALGSNGLPLMANVDRSFRSGIELDLNYKLTKTLSLTNSSNYAYCRIEGDGKEYQPLYTPSLIVNQGLEYTHKRFIIGVLVKYHSKSFINSDNTLTTPEFLTLNSNVSYIYKKYTISLQGINLTNKRYYTSGYAIGNDRYFFVNAPLSAYVTIKVEL